MRGVIFVFVILLCFSCQKEKSNESSEQNTKTENRLEVSSRKDTVINTTQNQPPIIPSEEIKKKLEKIANSQAILKVKPVQESKPETKKQPAKKSKTTPKAKPKKEVEVGKITWVDEEFDFGFIDHGDTIVHTFKFINTGKIPVEITNVVVGCGCTLPSYPLGEIMPGTAGNVEITFLSQNKVGSQKPSIEVFTTAEKEPKALILKGVVR